MFHKNISTNGYKIKHRLKSEIMAYLSVVQQIIDVIPIIFDGRTVYHCNIDRLRLERNNIVSIINLKLFYEVIIVVYFPYLLTIQQLNSILIR